MQLKVRRSSPADDAMHALIDVIFLLLIYFMCTATFSVLEKDLDADMPIGDSSTVPPSEELKDLEIIRIYVDETAGFRCNGVICADAPSLKHKLQTLRAHADVAVIIDGDAQTAFGRIVSAMNAAIGARFTKISFAARKPA